MTTAWLEVFATIGIFVAIVFVITFLGAIGKRIFTYLKFRKKKYQNKHRFKHPPKAKIYCTQCRNWCPNDYNRDDARCREWDKTTSSNEFCSRGWARTTEGYCTEEEKTLKGETE